MKVGKIFKNIVITTCLCSATFGVGLASQTIIEPSSIITYADERVEVTVYNSALKTRLLSLLGKKSSDKLFKDDFLINDNYKPTTDNTDPLHPITTASRYCLDLAGAGITDISDIVQFEFPSTLTTIDLSNNNITQSQLDKILEVINLNNTTTSIYHVDDPYFPRDLEVASNFSSNISCVNISLNNVDITKIAKSDLDGKYSKFLFGIQNLPILDSSALINSTELVNTYYYLRSTNNDIYYYGLTIKQNGQALTTTYDAVTQLINTDPAQISNVVGSYYITLGDPGQLGEYFKNTYVFDFNLISIDISPSYKIERGDVFSLDLNSDLKFNHAFPTNNQPTITVVNSPSTAVATFIDIKLKLTLEDGKSRIFTVKAEVVDTTIPVLTLIGPEKIYISQNSEYIDEGATAIDNYQTLDSGRIVVEGHVDTSIPGTYIITYNCTDLYGKKAEEITRTVVVVKGNILDKINISLIGDAIKGEKVTLEVSPRDNITVSDYKDFKYDIYQDGTKIMTRTGDAVTGKAQIPLTPLDDTTIKVVLTVTRVDNGEVLSIPPAEYRLELSAPPKDYTKLIIIAGGCIAFILLIVIIHAIKKTIKKKRTSQKEAKAKMEREGNVEIVKNFSGEGVSKEFMEAMQNLNTPSTIGQDPSTDPNRLGDLVDDIKLGEGDIPPNQVDNFGPLNPPPQQPMNIDGNNDVFIEDISEDAPPQNNNAIGRIDIAQVPSDQAINGGTHPEAGKPNNTNNFNNNSDDNGDIWI